MRVVKLLSRRRLSMNSLGLLAAMAVPQIAAAQQGGTTKPARCSAEAKVGDWTVKTSPNGLALSRTTTAPGGAGPSYQVVIVVTMLAESARKLDAKGSFRIAVVPGKRTVIQSTLAFWDKPSVKGRSSPVKVQATLPNGSPIPNVAADITAEAREGSLKLPKFTVTSGLTSRYELTLAENLLGALGRQSIKLAITPEGMAPIAIDLDNQTFLQAIGQGLTLQDQLIAAGATAKACEVKEDCFLTTACCEALGRTDDCFELATLRRFRASRLASTIEGQQLLADYDAFSPALVSAYGSRASKLGWLGIYLTTVLPCALLVHIGMERSAVNLYRRRVTTLRRRYPARDTTDREQPRTEA